MVIDKYLKLKNFRNITDMKLGFSENINLITGPNFSGKSNIFLAKRLLRFDRCDFSMKECIQEGKDIAELEEKFIIDGDTYLQTLVINKKGKKRTLIKNNEKPLINKYAVDKLNELFPKTLTQSACSYQQKSQGLIQLDPAKRRELIKKIFDIDYSEKVKSIADDSLNFKLDEQKYITTLTQLESNEFIPKDLIINNLTEEDIRVLKTDIALLEKELVQIRLIEKNKKDLKRSNETLNDVIKSIQTNANLINDLSSDNFNIDKKIKACKSLIDEVSKKLDNLVEIEWDNNDFLNINNKLTECKLQLDIKKSEIKDHENGVCSQCKRDYLPENTEILKKEGSTLITKYNMLIAEKNQSLERQKTYNEFIKNKSDLTNQITNFKNDLNIHINSKINIDKSLRQYAERKEELEDQKTHLNVQIESLKVTIDNSNQLHEVEEKIEFKRDSINKYNEVQTLNKQIKKDNELLLKKEIENKEKIKKNKDLLKKVTEDITDYKQVKNILKTEFPNYVISTLINNMQNAINKFVNDQGLDIQIEIRESSKSGIEIIDKSSGWDVRSKLSGYQQEIFSLAEMYALNTYIGNRFLWLDEIDASADVENSLKLYDTINNLSEYWGQIFLITHVDKTKDFLVKNGCNILSIEDGKLL
jgi:DNA repair exonuclease SbcCD ATPase subunit